MKRTHYLGYELTEWYPPRAKPVREGLYIIGSDELCVMSHWNGSKWLNGFGQELPKSDFCWRGVAHEI